MPTLTVPAFLDLLQTNQLLEATQLAEVRESAPAQGTDLPALCKLIFDKGWLTRFQLALLANGREIQFGPYRLLDKLGEGGMGQVFKAQHLAMNRLVALKVIRKDKLANPHSVQRFQREMQAAAKLVHQNIVVAYDAGQAGGTHYFAMEYVEGIDLGRMVKQAGPLPVGQSCDYIRQAALGLQHAHEQGLVHRDIKPSNLLVSRTTSQSSVAASAGGAPAKALQRSTVKILDMGLARFQDVDTGLTHEGSVVGTPDYLAPEQAVDSRSADIRCDIYSLGCSLYCLLTGAPPFQGTMAELLLKHQMKECTPIEEARPEVPPELGDVLRRLMAKNPDDRFQTPDEVAEALSPFCDTEGSVPLPTGNRAGGEKPGSSVNRPGRDTLPNQPALTPVPGAGRRNSQLKTGPATGRRNSQLKTAPARRQQGSGAKAVVLVGFFGVLALAGAAAWYFLGQPDPSPVVQATQPGKSVQPTASSSVATGKTRPTEPAKVVPKDPEPPAIPPTLTVAPLEDLNLRAGESQILVVKIERQGFKGPVSLLVSGLPNEIVTQPHTIEAEATVGHLRLQAAPQTAEMNRRIEIIAAAGNLVTRADLQLNVKKTEQAVGLPIVPRPMPVVETTNLGVHELQRIQVRESLLRSAVSGDGQRILLGSGTSLSLWGLRKAQEERRLPGHPNGGVSGLTMSADGRLAISAGFDRSVRVWDLTTGMEAKQLPSGPSPVGCLALSPDGRLAVGGSGTPLFENGRMVVQDNRPVFTDCVVRVWDLATGQLVRSLDGNLMPIAQVGFSGDGKRILAGSRDAFLTVWEADTGKQVSRQRLGFGGLSGGMAFTADGNHCFSAGGDRIIRLLNAETGQEERRFEGHASLAHALALSPDGKRLLSAAGTFTVQNGVATPIDCTVRLWETATGKELRRFEGHTQMVRNVGFSADGARAVSLSQDGTIRVWDARTGDVVVSKPPEPNPMTTTKPPLPRPLPTLPVSKKPMPPEMAKLDEARTLVRELYKADFAKKTPADRLALAGKLLAQGKDAKESAPARFVLLSEAINLAADLGDTALAMNAINQLDREWAVDTAALKLTALTSISRTALTPTPLRALAEAALNALDDAYDAYDFEAGGKLLAVAETALKKSSTPTLLARLEVRRKELPEYRKDHEAFQAAVGKLKESPQDAEASLAAGKFLCLRKDDWEQGLPWLAAGGDGALAAPARKDVAKPKEPAAQAELADAWWDLAEADKSSSRPGLQRRALHWYKEALPGLAQGLTRTKAEQRSKTLTEQLAVLKPEEKPPVVIAPPPKTDGIGLQAELFADRVFQRKVKTRIDHRIDWVWGEGAPDLGMPVDFFSVRWTGWIRAPKPGLYKFISHADDEIKLWIDDKLLLEKGLRQEVAVELTGKPQPIKLEFAESAGMARCSLFWVRPGSSIEQVVPAEVLFHDRDVAQKTAFTPPVLKRGTGLKTELFAGRNFERPFKTRLDAQINASWPDRVVAEEGLSHDDFSIRWTGWLKAPKAGQYRLSVYADDGVRVWIDNKKELESIWRPGISRVAATVDLTDKPHALRVEFYQVNGPAHVSLHWEQPGGFPEVIIPAEAFFSDKAVADKAK
jgi:serine/threonine protein kinase/WD40 repeat protein